MGEFDHWHTLEKFSVDEAALLIAKVNPGSVISKIMFRKSDHLYVEYYSAKKILVEGILSSEELKEKICYDEKDCYHVWDLEKKCDGGIPNWDLTKLTREEIRSLLQDKEIHSEFFSTSGKPGYLDPIHLHYVPKLAAVVNAWLEVEGTAETKEETVKELLIDWLTEHAEEYEGLAYEDDKRTRKKSVINALAKVANWEPKAGRPKKRS